MHYFAPNLALSVKCVKLGRSILPCILIDSGYGSNALDFGYLFLGHFVKKLLNIFLLVEFHESFLRGYE